jgi:hypothetical protein
LAADHGRAATIHRIQRHQRLITFFFGGFQFFARQLRKR